MPRESFLLRTDPKVLDALRRWAEDDLRSVNGQLDYVLRKALRDAKRWKPTTDLPESEPSKPDSSVSDTRDSKTPATEKPATEIKPDDLTGDS